MPDYGVGAAIRFQQVRILDEPLPGDQYYEKVFGENGNTLANNFVVTYLFPAAIGSIQGTNQFMLAWSQILNFDNHQISFNRIQEDGSCCFEQHILLMND